VNGTSVSPSGGLYWPEDRLPSVSKLRSGLV
jgi:hypothetical protein